MPWQQIAPVSRSLTVMLPSGETEPAAWMRALNVTKSPWARSGGTGCRPVLVLPSTVRSTFGVAFTDPCARPVPPADADGYPVRVDDSRGCPVFVARTVTGFDPAAPTPDWLATRIRLAGMRPISLAVDVTNYVMLETGRPIHGYDGDRLHGPLVVRRAAAGERLRTLDGTDRVLVSFAPCEVSKKGVVVSCSTLTAAELETAECDAIHIGSLFTVSS